MQDASKAESEASRRVFGPDITILMCWYHLMYNVKKRLKSLKQFKTLVNSDINSFHCLSQEDLAINITIKRVYTDFKKKVFLVV